MNATCKWSFNYIHFVDVCRVAVRHRRDQVLTDLATAGYANIASMCAGNAYGLLELQVNISDWSQPLVNMRLILHCLTAFSRHTSIGGMCKQTQHEINSKLK